MAFLELMRWNKLLGGKYLPPQDTNVEEEEEVKEQDVVVKEVVDEEV